MRFSLRRALFTFEVTKGGAECKPIYGGHVRKGSMLDVAYELDLCGAIFIAIAVLSASIARFQAMSLQIYHGLHAHGRDCVYLWRTQIARRPCQG